MRFNKNQDLTCSKIIDEYSEKALADIIWKFGEEEESRRIAKFIVNRRASKIFQDTIDLAEVIKLAKRKKTKKHPATKTFQALRMAVNSELDSLKICLETLKEKLIKSGRVVIISFHSLEDRIAKHSFKQLPNIIEKKIPILSEEIESRFSVSKIIYPSDKEISMNPRARSAKMRIIEKL